MCGRFLIKSLPGDIAEFFNAPEEPSLFDEPRFNIAPTQTVPVVVEENGARQFRPMRWGLIPAWAKDRAIGYRTINAKCETVAEKPAFRGAFRKRRCLVPASGFFEWRKEGKKRFPILLRPRSGLFAFAGLWETWHGEDQPLDTFTIITTEANELVRPVHDRMPVALHKENFPAWLDVNDGDVMSLLRPYPADEMTAVEVDTWVNDVRHEGPRCIEPATNA
jgi:putative SOS response-associated peptidase YedK